MSATSAAKRAVAESCIDYLTLELVNTYRKQLQGPPLQVNSTRPPPPPEHAWAGSCLQSACRWLCCTCRWLCLQLSLLMCSDLHGRRRWMPSASGWGGSWWSAIPRSGRRCWSR